MHSLTLSGVFFLSITALAAPLPHSGGPSPCLMRDLGAINKMPTPFCDDHTDNGASREAKVQHNDELEPLVGNSAQRRGVWENTIGNAKQTNETPEQLNDASTIPEGHGGPLPYIRRESVYRGGGRVWESNSGAKDGAGTTDHINWVYDPAYPDAWDDDEDVWKRGLGCFHFLGISMGSGCSSSKPKPKPKPVKAPRRVESPESGDDSAVLGELENRRSSHGGHAAHVPWGTGKDHS